LLRRKLIVPLDATDLLGIELPCHGGDSSNQMGRQETNPCAVFMMSGRGDEVVPGGTSNPLQYTHA